MDDFLKKVIEGSGIEPSTVCLDAFNQNFENAVNVEWFSRGEYFEAIFYKDNLEHIAMFNLNGGLIEYKVNLPKEFLPETIKNMLEEKGEIMNVVMINKGNTVEYEVIVRDKELNRILVIISEIGRIQEERKL
ncbi:MAG: hypothetical protein JW894_07105 [Bacteroidales bacterium]|nr:hypothetical protein [Bacteroidales bacterium]